jgi:hypothetical protein
MKTFSFNLLATATFLALSVSPVAFGEVSVTTSYSSDTDFASDEPVVSTVHVAVATPSQSANPNITAANLAALKARTAALKSAAAAARAASQKAAATNAAAVKQAQARLAVVNPNTTASSTSVDIPAGRVRVVVPGSSKPKTVTPAHVVVVTPDDLSKTPEALKGLTGDWMAVSRQSGGELSTVELQMDDHGWAKLTVPGAEGKPSKTTKHKVELKDNKLELTSQNGTISLGKLESSDSRQMILEQETGLLTLVRP